MDYNNQTFGKRLFYLRKKRNISQRQLADLCGISITSIQKYESGTLKEPTVKNVAAIADFFEVSVDWLIGKGN